jgi:hypothetical protein
VAPNFISTLAKLRLGKVWIGTKQALNVASPPHYSLFP